MSHEIDMSNNRANMAYRGEKPWHGLGQELTADAPLEVWTKEAGLDWEVKRSRVRFAVDRIDFVDSTTVDSLQIMPERHVLFRSDTKVPLSIVSDDYKIVQPREVIEFFRELVDTAGFKMETAGVLFGGKRVWALARTGDSSNIKGSDELRGYLLLATSCDGSLATRGLFTSVRVVCNNTLQVSGIHEGPGSSDGSGGGVGGNGSGGVRIPHSTSFDPAAVKRDLGLIHSMWADFENLVLKLADRKVDKYEARRWLIETFGDIDKPEDDQPNARMMKAVWGAVVQSPGAGLLSAAGTAWGLVNGVTYYLDHARSTRTRDSRLSSAWFGEGVALKKRAVQNAIKLLGN